MSLSIFKPTDPPKPTEGILDRLDGIAAKLRERGADEGMIGTALRRFIHSPVVALLVKVTATPVDDAVLELLKEMFPAA